MQSVKLIENKADLASAFEIRDQVFVQEQKVAKELEYDEFEETSRHFLAFFEGTPCGTARWRFTDKGVKLERFAVLAAYRSKGIGAALVQKVIDDILENPQYSGQLLYLHAQITALPLYRKFGFVEQGAEFIEADIRHYKMVRQ